MVRHWQFAVVVVALAIIPNRARCDDEPYVKDKVVCAKKFDVIGPAGPAAPQGSYRIQALERLDRKSVQISEDLTIPSGGRTISFGSTVTYRLMPNMAPLRGFASTQANGQRCMTGEVQFQEKTLSIACQGLFDHRQMKKIDPPRRFEKKDLPRPAGFILFQSATTILGPRLLPKAGELKDIAFAEFPDDVGAPELIQIKPGYRLVRGEADEAGSYTIRVFGPHDKNPVIDAQLNNRDSVTTMNLYGKFKLVEPAKE